MNIYAQEVTKVKYTGTGGYDHQKEHANEYLEKDKIYTVLRTEVSRWHTDVFLKEVPNQCFNSVHFEEVKETKMDKLKNADVALKIAGFNFKKKDLETILKMIEMSNDQTTLAQIATAKEHIEKKYEK